MKRFKITKKILREFADPKVFQRGEEYFENELVEEILWNGSSYHAIVEGTEIYKIEIIKDDNGEIYFDCSCPYDWGGICKHCVAVGLKILREPEKIQVISNEIIEEKKEKKSIKKSISKLLRQATYQQKDEFLKTLLQKNNDLLLQFEVFIRGEMGIESNIDIDESCRVLIKKLENLNFSHRNLLNNVPDSGGRYYEEWEAFYEAAIRIIRKKISQELNQIETFLKNGLHLEALKILFALYEANELFKEDEVIYYEYDIIESVKDEVYNIWKEYLDEYLKKMEVLNIEVKSACLELFLLRISLKNNLYSYQHFSNFIFKFIEPGTITFIEQRLLPEFFESDTAEIRMDIAETRKDEQKWLQLAEKYYSEQPEIGTRILGYFEKNQMKNEFIQKAKILFEKWPPFYAEDIHDFLDYEDDKQLYHDALLFLAKEKNELKYFQDLKKITDDETLEDLLEQISRKYNYSYYIQVLEEMEKFQEIRDFFDNHIDSWEFDAIIKPIINIYPRHCFDKIRIYAEKKLEYSGSRDHYRNVASQIKWLYKIENKEIMIEAKDWIKNLLQKYIRRPAMLDEFRQEGIE